MIAVQTNGPYLIHAKGNGVRKLEDMKGLKVRGPTSHDQQDDRDARRDAGWGCRCRRCRTRWPRA